MATLVLTAVGTAIGGPIGGAVGAIIGQQFDQNILFRPRAREGPRLQELAVQTSSYGAQIPRFHGRMRVAGTVIWATDLKETRRREGGGKGRPSTTIYSYSTCFAVALSSRPIRDIGRIWADGKIFRGAAGDFKTDTQFAFHTGWEDQPVDGLMASAEAADGTPAYRGLALAVFGDMDLTEYGNRIPSLTFEVIADDGSVTIADIITDISAGRVAMSAGDTVTGFAAGGGDRRTALQTLAGSIPLSFTSDPSSFDHIAAEMRAGANAVSAMTLDGDFASLAGKQDIAPPERRTQSIAATTRQMSIRYYDPSRDYQAGIQSALRPGAGRIAVVREFPAAIAADRARAMAATGLASEYGERATLQLAVPLGSRICRPAMLVQFDGFEGLWRVRECEFRSAFVQLLLTRASANGGPATVETEEGRNIADEDVRAGPTRMVLVDLPFAVDAPTVPSDSARLYAAAAGDAGWRNAQLFASGPDAAPGAYIGQIPAPTVIGTALGLLQSANPALIDRFNHVDVEMQNPAMTLAFADDAQLLAGTNIAAIGREIIQFAEAVPLGENRFRLSRLIRGLGGTEVEISRHSGNEDFVLIDPGSMFEIGPSVYTPFSPVTVHALGRDDPEPVSSTIATSGRALLPWSPVHPSWNFLPNGNLEIGWVRRSRAGTKWSDHVEVPLAEESEKYLLELYAQDGVVAATSRETLVPQAVIAAAEVQSLFSANNNHISARIYQIGAHGRSEALAFDIPV